ncbi:RluA family pseudouridine synthase [Nostoc edaphicum]|nr:RluA family pseudouridine synthase [Nostoc edaphicum]
MVILHVLSDFIDCDFTVSDSSCSYWYEGRCPQSGDCLKLPRTSMSEAIANGLMKHLANNEKLHPQGDGVFGHGESGIGHREDVTNAPCPVPQATGRLSLSTHKGMEFPVAFNECYSREGKMYGILLVELPNGEQRVLKAFSGLLNGCSLVEGWVSPIPGRDEVALEEAHTLAQLDAIKQEILSLKQLTERQQYETLFHEFEQQLQAMSDRHRHCKHQRQEKRQQICNTLTSEALTIALEQLDEESRQQGIERRQLKRQQNAVLQPLQQLIAATDARISELKQQRKALSRQLQAQMHATYSLTNFSGRSQSLQELMPGGSPTGTGDCCAPKLLHYAATNNLKPLAMAEFWWGASSVNQDKIQGEFYGACTERCQPLMGFLLSGLRPNPPAPFPAREGGVRSLSLPIIYEDEWLIAVNKPAGLLSVPGRYRDRQDSVLSRLRNLLFDGMALVSVHRLDQETSGILLLARDRQTHRQLSQQFQQRQIHKVYEAILSGAVKVEQGVIDLPLWGDPENRPEQKVDWQHGKPSLTHFQVMTREGDYTRVEFTPRTGRTHQLRVHAADARGLGVTILGDRLYGCCAVTSRLHLHARELRFEHPQLEKTLHLQAITPF